MYLAAACGMLRATMRETGAAASAKFLVFLILAFATQPAAGGQAGHD